MFDVTSIEGQPWRVQVDLAGDTDRTLVVPEPLRQGPTTAGGDKFALRTGITILGIYYNYIADAADEGFDLFSDDDVAVPGSSRSFRLWGDRSAAAGRVAQSLPDIWIPLSPSTLTGTPTNGASLRFDLIGTPTYGTLTIIGVHGIVPRGKFGFTGSPITWNNT